MEINFSDVQSTKYNKYPELLNADARCLCGIINNVAKYELLTRAVALMALLEHHSQYFNKLSYSEKMSMFENTAYETIFVVYGGTKENFPLYLVDHYLRRLHNDAQLFQFANVVKEQVPSIYPKTIKDVCQHLHGSELAHEFLRHQALEGTLFAAQRLACFKRSEDVSILTGYFLPNCRIGTLLPQYQTVIDYNSSIPFAVFDTVLYSLPPQTKIHARLVCKKWFNFFNSEQMWEGMCKEHSFIQVPRFGWLQSYFMQVHQAVKQYYMNPGQFAASKKLRWNLHDVAEIVVTYPHPLFLSLLFLHSNDSDSVPFARAVMSYSKQAVLDWFNQPDFKSFRGFARWYIVLLEKNWHTDPIFAPYFIGKLPLIIARLTSDTLQMLYKHSNKETMTKLRAMLQMPYNNINFFRLHADGRFQRALVEILNNEPDFYIEWKAWFLSFSAAEWQSANILGKFVEVYMKNDSKTLPLLRERLQTTNDMTLLYHVNHFLGKR